MKRLQYYSTSRHTCTFCPLLNQWSSLTATVLYSTSRAPVTVTVTSHSTAHSTNYMRAPVHSTSALPGKFILPEWHIAFYISHMPKPIALPSQDRTWVFSHVSDDKTTNMGLGMFKCELPHDEKALSAYKLANTWLTAPLLLVGRLADTCNGQGDPHCSGKMQEQNPDILHNAQKHRNKTVNV